MDLINKHKIVNPIFAKKNFGQNFLIDKNICRKIVNIAGKISEQHIFEIGPGPGSLTEIILENITVEILD